MLRADTTDMTVRSRRIPGEPAIAVISVVVQNNGPAIYIKSLNGFQFEVADTGGDEILNITCSVMLHNDGATAPFYISLNPALKFINFIDHT